MKIINMNAIISTILLLLLVSETNAQIKTNREYDYVGNETNNAGLRVVGVKNQNQTHVDFPDGSYGGRYLYGCIDADGKEVVPLQYVRIDFSQEAKFIKVYKLSYVSSSATYVCGLLTEDGKYSYAYTKYKDIGVEPYTFNTHKCAIFKTEKNHYGIVNSHAEEIVPPIYDAMCWINKNKGYLAVKLNGLWGIIDYKGKEIVVPQWDDLKSNLSDGFLISLIYGGSPYGKAIEIPYRDEFGELNSDDKLIAVANKSKWGFVNSEGKIIIPSQYYNNSGIITWVYHKKWEDIEKNTPVFFNGIVILKDSNSGKFGALDKHNNIVVPFEYDKLFDYNGYAMWACKDDKYFIISNKGEVLRNVSGANSFKSYRGVLYSYKSKNDKRKNEMSYDDLGRQYASYEEAKAANDIIRKADLDKKKKDVDYEEKTLAVLEWSDMDENISQSEYELKVKVKSPTKITSVSVSVNGTQDRGIKTVDNTGYDMVIMRTLSLVEGKNVIRVAVTNEAGTTQEEKTINYQPHGKNLPVIDWLDFASTTTKQEYHMRLGIRSKSKIEDVSVTVNGLQTRGAKTTESDEYEMTVDRTVTLSEGTNRIVVSVRNAEGISTSEKVITYKGVSPTPVINEKRIALIIGNSHYSNEEMNLANPKNDAEDVAEKLEQLGFEVTKLIDGSLEQIDKELSTFAVKAKDYEVALFYYAGHGIQSKGVNYILPTNIDNLTEDNIRYKCVDSGRVLDAMELSNCKLKIVVLDACRNDPVSRSWHRSSASRGLSLMNAPIGTIIAFSTAPGQTAQDGNGHNSPYTEAFLSTLDIPNLDALHFFQSVGASVQKKTQRSQIPWLSSSFTGDFYFNKQ